MIDRKFSCPAVSQICTLTALPLVCTVPEANSQATVTWWCFRGFCSVKFSTMHDLPTPVQPGLPDSPTITNLNRKSKWCPCIL